MLTVDFTVAGIPCLAQNGGPAFRHSEAFSFQIATDDRPETDRLGTAIVGQGGQESACGWVQGPLGRLVADSRPARDRRPGGPEVTRPSAPSRP